MEPDFLTSYRESQNLKHLVELFKPFEKGVFRMCMHYLKHTQDSEDAVVDIFLELKDKVLKYDIQNFPAWLHTLVRNHCLKKLKAKARILLVEGNIPDEHVESEENTDQLDRMLVALPAAIDELDERQRWCIVLFYLHGKSYKEIESLRDCSAMEVKSAIQNGKIKLKKILSSYVG
jgi:RNA polymerase sigma-70 factor, ECF subfamily